MLLEMDFLDLLINYKL